MPDSFQLMASSQLPITKVNAKEEMDLYKCLFDKCGFVPKAPSLIDFITQVL